MVGLSRVKKLEYTFAFGVNAMVSGLAMQLGYMTASEPVIAIASNLGSQLSCVLITFQSGYVLVFAASEMAMVLARY